ncbi:hypothetical protein CDD81_5913 [Ophiocordyceps australis]|uniref:DH domain-containing protein n=1 Tax=Ophiocordyceps australis TaxID=1399860 RepID=A0A2C5YIQ1_9HYPO|nr:hypothetical protein CDD81_5913 [Ophiocordyceps australis]
MVRVTDELALPPDTVSLYHASDALLGNLPVLVFHGPSTTANYTLNSSRVQVHVFTAAGFRCFPRLTISPSSPFYAAVKHLPRELQGDELQRGLAFGLFKYFCELSDVVKAHLADEYRTKWSKRTANAPSSTPLLFGEEHVADLVAAMVKGDNAPGVMTALQDALQTQHISNIDVDLVLPPGAIVPLQPADLEEVPDDEADILDPTLRQYLGYSPLVKLFGEPVFLPTTKLRRAPSKPTSLNRTKSFSRDQKFELRMKLAELVDTEDRYVAKLGELVHHIATDFRESARKRPPNSLSPSEEELERLFPRSADHILQVNSAFLEQLRCIMDETEDEALRDMESLTGKAMGSHRGGNSQRARDPSGALAMARLFLEWFPRFTDCYQDYIKASQHFPTLLNSFLDQQSSFKQRVNQAGEQAIRSTLIEPVQRLPRYSLLIDQIVGCLPMVHPALQPMLKARDIITSICSMDDPLPDKPHVASRLRSTVEAWPLELEPQGRLILAADFVELEPPLQSNPNDLDALTGVFLLFADCIVLLRKTRASLTGRDLLRELDRPSAAELLISMTNAAGGPSSYGFSFSACYALSDVRFTESANGSLVWMTSTRDSPSEVNTTHHHHHHKLTNAATSSSISPTMRCFLLQESWAGKAGKWTEEVVKARVEARFSEKEREDARWTLRSSRAVGSTLSIHVAVFEEGAHQLIEGRREPAPVRVVVDHQLGTKGAPVGHYGVEIAVDVATGNMKRLALVVAGLGGRQFQDEVVLEDFLPTLIRRITQLLSSQFDVGNPQLTAPLVSYYIKTLRRLNMSGRAEKTRSFLPSSPVKLLSSLWGNNNSNSAIDATGTQSASGSLSSRPALHRSNSHHSVLGSLRGSRDEASATSGGGHAHLAAESMPENPLMRLEQTFTGYIAALQGRKGAIMGHALLNRSSIVDELTVNDLYNRLIESPFDYEAAADVPTEAVFVAFENFLTIAWTEQMGPVMSMQSLDTLQERANKRVPGNFADFVNYLYRDMAPQNRRAFTALVKLLADLLDGCGNDSDRGALTLAFAELLVADQASAPNYINLLDRLVDDCDRIFEDPATGHQSVLSLAASGGSGSAESSLLGSVGRGRGHQHHIQQQQHQSLQHNSGSVTSNASSLRRKFGLDLLLRQNPKDEKSSVWRSLSRHHRHAGDATSSLSRAAALGRTRSIDDCTLAKRLTQPMARERPPVAGAFDEARQRPVSSYPLDTSLDTIGEPAADGPKGSGANKSGRRKRRSSLSDLTGLVAATKLDDDEDDRVDKDQDAVAASQESGNRELPKVDDAPQPLRTTKQTSGKMNASATVASSKMSAPSRIPTSPGAGGFTARTPRQKENWTEGFGSLPLSVGATLARPEVTTAPLKPETAVKQETATLQQQGLGKKEAAATKQEIAASKTPLTSPRPSESIARRRGHAKTLSSSSIPMLKPARPSTSGIEAWARPASPLRPATATVTQKLRLQSPQKLRERLQTEKRAVQEVNASLQSELHKIGEEMARLNGGSSSKSHSQQQQQQQQQSAELRQLWASLKATEAKVSSTLNEVREQQATTQRELESTLKTTETKLKAVDQLHKEAVAENELLYEKFSSELGKVVRAVAAKKQENGGDAGREELVARFREQGDELARVKKENVRLKRENINLRAAMNTTE